MYEIPFQPTSTAPAPGTTTTGGWEDFISSVVRGANSIITTARQPNNGGWAGTTQPSLTQPAPGSSMLGLLVLVALVWIVMEAA